jgi:hypothetical protein
MCGPTQSSQKIIGRLLLFASFYYYYHFPLFVIILFLVFETGSCYVAQADPELEIFLPFRLPSSWDFRGAPPCLAYYLTCPSTLFFFLELDIELRTSISDKGSTT